jgi:hypothetical protein
VQNGGSENTQRVDGAQPADAVGQPERGLSPLGVGELPLRQGDQHGPVFYLTRNEGGLTRNIYVPPELHLARGLMRTPVIASWDSNSPRLMRTSGVGARSGGGVRVIERRHRQRNLFEAIIGSVEQLIEQLIEPPLMRLDEVLGDEALLETVMQRLAQPCGAVCTNASERKPRGVAPAEGHRPTPVAAYFADAP